MAKDGEIIYELRGDDSHLDADLNQAEKKAEQSAKKTGQKSEQIERETGATQKKVKEDVTNHHIQQNDARENDDIDSGNKREETAKKHGENLKSIAGGTAKAIGASMVAVGSAVVGIGVSSVNSANDMQKAMNQYIASTGKGVEETDRYKKILEEIYVNNYGENFEDIGQAMAEVTKQLGDLNDASLQDVTESAFALRDTFGYEIPESTRAAKALIDNFGISGEQAMNLIAAGAQNGLDYSGELIDSINEYSVQFAKVGLDADDMFKIFEKGAETGAWNLDKIGDAVKEMSIRVIDGSETTSSGFQAIGLDAAAMSAKFAAGGASAKKAFQETVTALASVKDPLKQNTAGVALFGTMWEDLGPEVVTQLADIEDGAYDTGEALEEIQDVKYDDIGSVFEDLTRTIEMLVIPLGEQLIPMLMEMAEEVLPLVQENLPPLIELIAGFAEQLFPVVQEILPLILDLVQELLPVLTQLISELLPPIIELISTLAPLLTDIISSILPVLIELFEKLIPPILEIIETLLPPLIELINALLPIFATLIDLLDPIIELFLNLLDPIVDLIEGALTPLVEALQPIIDIIQQALTPVLEALGEVFEKTFGLVKDVVSNHIKTVTNVLKGIIDFIKNVFTGNWKGAWEAVKNIFGSIWEGIKNLFKLPINWIIDGINTFLKALNKIKVPDWVPAVGGKGFNIPLIPRLQKGMDFVPADFFPAYLDYGERVLTAEQNAKFNFLGGIAGMEAALSGIPTQGRDKTITIVTPVQIDGREVARATATYTSEQMTWEEL